MRSMIAIILASIPISSLAGAVGFPDVLTWTDCGENKKCGVLEFCQNGSNYGYRALNDIKFAESVPCGSTPGPLIRMKRGTIYKLTLRNTSTSPTNLHTHGLHVVGDGDGDDVTRIVEGGNMCLDYTWDIASDHPGGTNWYHPHIQGVTNVQVKGGAFGMIIIEDDDDQINDWASRVENERLLVSLMDRNLQVVGYQDQKFIPDHWYRLRTLIVTANAEPNTLAFGTGCTVYKVASDGIWHMADLTAYKGSSFELTGASRADLAIRCSEGTHDISWGGEVIATIDSSGEHQDVFNVGGVSSTGDDAIDLGNAPSREASILDLSSVSISASNQFTVAAQRDSMRFDGDEYPEMSGLGDLNFDEVYEMTIEDSKRHPFHLHLYRMQIMTGGGCGEHVKGEFYDTIAGEYGQPCTVRFLAADVGQKMIMHCHGLQHEDDGAINFFNVVNVPESRKNTVDSPSYTCPVVLSDDGIKASATNETTSTCNLSFCEGDADCCDGSCTHYGRCSNVNPGFGSVSVVGIGSSSIDDFVSVSIDEFKSSSSVRWGKVAGRSFLKVATVACCTLLMW